MSFHDIQNSFARGEIDPELHGRSDLAFYKSALKTCRNFIPGMRGVLSNRPGTLFIAQTKYNDKSERIIPFIFSQEDAFVLEVGDQYIRFYKDGSQIKIAGIPYEISTPYLGTEVFDIKYTQSADTLYLVHPNHRPKKLQRITDDNWVLSDYGFENGPYRFPNTNTAISMSQSLTFPLYLISSASYFVSGMDNSVFEVDQFVLNGLISLEVSGTTTGVLESVTVIPGGVVGIGTLVSNLPCGSTWRFITAGDWVGKVAIQQSIDGGSTWETIQSYVSDGTQNVNTFGSVDISITNQQPYLIRANLFVHASGTIKATLTTDAFTYPRYLVTGSVADSTHIEIVSDSASYLRFLPSINWAEGAWSNYRGWPQTVAFVQDRLAFGGNDEQTNMVWMTKTSNYVDFGRSAPLVDSDGITVPVLSRQVNPIKNMVSILNSLLVFTEESEFTVGANQDTSITPSTVISKVQGYRGSSKVRPLIIGNRVIYISAQSSTVRDLSYQYLTNNFDSENISVFSDHLFRGKTIVDMAYQKEADSLVWMVRSDGKLLTLTYLREQETLAWARHDTNGTFKSIAIVPGALLNDVKGADDIYFVAQRGNDGNKFIERMLPRYLDTDPTLQYFSDSGYLLGSVGPTVTGLNHLEGLHVAINADGFVLPQQIVTSGQIVLDKAYDSVRLGTAYDCDVETLNPEIPMRDGTFQDRKYQINIASIRFLNSREGHVGPDLDTLDALSLCGSPLMRDPSLAAATPTPLFSGYIKFPLRRNDDTHGRICFRQSDPMPVTILGIYPIVEPGENP